MAKFA